MNYYEKLFATETQMNILRAQILELMQEQLKNVGEWVEHEPIHVPAYLLYSEQLKSEMKVFELHKKTAENYRKFGENQKKFEE